MEAARYEVRMRQPAKDGASTRDHLEAAAAHGNAVALAALEGPEIPDTLRYLYHHALALDAARGWSQHGPLSVTYHDVAAYAALVDWHPQPHEVEALMALDVVLRYPDAGEQPEAEVRVAKAWPSKKDGA